MSVRTTLILHKLPNYLKPLVRKLEVFEKRNLGIRPVQVSPPYLPQTLVTGANAASPQDRFGKVVGNSGLRIFSMGVAGLAIASQVLTEDEKPLPQTGGYDVSESVLEHLRRNPGTLVMGLPGSEARYIPFRRFDAHQFMLPDVENTGMYACISASLITQEPSIMFATLGPGAMNCFNAVDAARLDRRPAVLIVPQLAPIKDSPDAHQHLNPKSFKYVAKAVLEVTERSHIDIAIKKAIALSKQEPQGPVVVSVRFDVLSDTTPVSKKSSAIRIIQPKVTHEAMPDKTHLTVNELQQVVRFLKDKKDIVIYAAGRVIRDNACRELEALCSLLPNAYVVYPYDSKGVISEHSRFAGIPCTTYAKGIWRSEALPEKEIFSKADGVLILGFDKKDDVNIEEFKAGNPDRPVLSLGEMFSRGGTRSGLPNFDGNIKETLRQIIETLKSDPDFTSEQKFTSGKLQRSALSETVLGYKTRLNHIAATAPETDSNGSLNIIKIFTASELQALLKSGNGQVVSDIGLHRHYGVAYLPATYPQQVYSSAGSSSFGTAIAQAIGISKSNIALGRHRPIVVIVGDAGTRAQLGALTAVEPNMPITILVLDNKRNLLIEEVYSKHSTGVGQTGGRATKQEKIEYVGIAQQAGVSAVHVESLSELNRELSNAFRSTGPRLIHVNMFYPEVEMAILRGTKVLG
ncbi:thiamine pyrophosphate-binding protein [bacterium]|nr:thiamine pyrophosphate-binding protein [bacterium]